MITNTDLVRYEKVFKLEYEKASRELADNTVWNELAALGTEITSDGAEEDYRWLGDLPEFAELVGDIDLDDLGDYTYTIKNKDFGAAVKVRKNELEDDKMDIIRPRISGLPAGERRKWGKLIHDLIVNGHTNKAFDGVAFFSDASGVRLNDNLLAGTISAGTPTLAQVAADIKTVRAAGMKFKNTRGEVVGVVFDNFVVPPDLEILFRQLQTSSADPTTSNSGTANPYRGLIKSVIVDPGLTDTNDFYAFASGYSVGPFVRQKRRAVETVLDSTDINKNGTCFFKADFRGNVGYGLPILAAKVVSSAS
jgi:phage major head subunit gpT-like protein